MFVELDSFSIEALQQCIIAPAKLKIIGDGEDFQ